MSMIKDTGTRREEDIRAQAYEIYLTRVRRGEPGNPVQDWCQAERELMARAGLQSAVG